MQDVPKFVVKRLKEAALAADAHPDADLLTAFAEQSLAGRERERVMEHLARCGDCRDVVALALPKSEIAALPSVKSSPAGWLRWPGLGWGVAAAGVLAATLVGVLQYSHENERKMVASNVAQERVAAPAGLSQPASTQVTAPQVERKKQGADALGSRLTARATRRTTAARAVRGDEAKSVAGYGSGMAAGVGSGVGGGIGSGGGSTIKGDAFAPSAPDAGPGQNTAPVMRQQVAVGATSEVVEVQSAAGAVNKESTTVERNIVAQNQSMLPLQGRNTGDLDVVKAKEPGAGQGASAAPIPGRAAPGPLRSSAALMVRALPRWTVSSSGVLQRSFDGGGTWEDMNPDVTAVGGGFAKAGVGRAEVGGGLGPAEAAPTKQSRKISATANAALVFRAVAASGAEVWAGGSGGALYHTADGGNSWTRVTPSSNGVALTGDVIGIQFFDMQHGTVVTSNGEMWTTSDSGQTWRRQR